MLESLDEEEQQMFRGYFIYYRDQQGIDPIQAKSLALLATFEDRCAIDLADDLHKTIYSENGQPMEVPKDTMIEAHVKYAREKRMKEHYEGMSKHGSGSSDGSGHGNLDLLVNDGKR